MQRHHQWVFFFSIFFNWVVDNNNVFPLRSLSFVRSSRIQMQFNMFQCDPNPDVRSGAQGTMVACALLVIYFVSFRSWTNVPKDNYLRSRGQLGAIIGAFVIVAWLVQFWLCVVIDRVKNQRSKPSTAAEVVVSGGGSAS